MQTDLENIIDAKKIKQITLSNGENVDVDVPTADVLLTVLRALEDDNKQKMLELLNSNIENFMKVVKFAWENVEGNHP